MDDSPPYQTNLLNKNAPTQNQSFDKYSDKFKLTWLNLSCLYEAEYKHLPKPAAGTTKTTYSVLLLPVQLPINTVGPWMPEQGVSVTLEDKG